MAKVGILMGSKSDFDVVKPAVAVLKKFGVEKEKTLVIGDRIYTDIKSGLNAYRIPLFCRNPRNRVAAILLFPSTKE